MERVADQQRVQIVVALIHRREALVLDKPLLFSSHQLDLVERLCDDLVILSEGRVSE